LAEYARNYLHRSIPLSDTSLIKLVVDERRPFCFHDAQADKGAARRAAALWGTRAILAVPIILKGRMLAVAIGLNLDENCTCTDQQMELISGIANAVAPAIENARLHQMVEQLAVLEERSLLAQEIHDELAQTLGAIRFRASLTNDFLINEQWTQVREGVLVLKDMIDAAYTGVREAIFNLRSITSLGSGGLEALQGYLDNYRKYYGLDVSLEADGEAVDALVACTGVQTIRIIQEAISNVRRHGQTTQARVQIKRKGPWVRITIKDDGQGFDPAAAPGEKSQHFGLQFMRERAAKVGGTLAVESQPGQGTQVILCVPYNRDGVLQ
ncbi:MAG: hypothetical protein JXA42_18265, partial [Anaerolineales bacterium]|nr:hypothetical protein [Anaerolineales bacterium]